MAGNEQFLDNVKSKIDNLIEVYYRTSKGSKLTDQEIDSIIISVIDEQMTKGLSLFLEHSGGKEALDKEIYMEIMEFKRALYEYSKKKLNNLK